MPVCTTDYSTCLAVLTIYVSKEEGRDNYLHIQNSHWTRYAHNPRTKINVKPKSYNQHGSRTPERQASSARVQDYNSIPAGLAELEDIPQPAKSHVEIFKGKLDSYLKDIPDIPGSLANLLCQNLE